MFLSSLTGGSLSKVPFHHQISKAAIDKRHKQMSGFPGGSDGKNLPAVQEAWFDPWVGKIPWRRKWLSIPVFLPGKSHGQRNLAGYSPWGHRVGHDWATNTTTLNKYAAFQYNVYKSNQSSLLNLDFSAVDYVSSNLWTRASQPSNVDILNQVFLDLMH